MIRSNGWLLVDILVDLIALLLAIVLLLLISLPFLLYVFLVMVVSHFKKE